MREWLADLFGIGSATLVDDSGEMQLVQVTERAAGRGIGDRILGQVRRVVEFGFTSVPPLGSEVLVARRGGRRSLSMVIGTSHRPSRPRNLQPGDTAIYDVRGATVELTANGLVIDCAGLPAVVRNFQSMTIEGDLDVTGDVRSRGGAVSVNALHDAYDAHRHTGVAAGGGSSGPTDHAV